MRYRFLGIDPARNFFGVIKSLTGRVIRAGDEFEAEEVHVDSVEIWLSSKMIRKVSNQKPTTEPAMLDEFEDHGAPLPSLIEHRTPTDVEPTDEKSVEVAVVTKKKKVKK
jgi:hypothetical protein